MTHKESTTETRHTMPANSAGSKEKQLLTSDSLPKKGLKSPAGFINKRSLTKWVEKEMQFSNYK